MTVLIFLFRKQLCQINNMDIVDINKVLDDLELNEEEQHSKLTKPTAHSDAENQMNKQPQRQQQQQYSDLYAPYKYGPITGPSNPIASGVPGAAAVPNRIPKTNFVKVSNVFNR